jgi:hypothetical protein
MASKYLNCALSEMPKEDICILLKTLKEELKNRRSLDDMINELENAYKNNNWGYGDWKSESTGYAVKELESLRSLEHSIRNAILSITDDVEAQWKAALSFSLILTRMIVKAEDYAGKRVNGSCGEWCPGTASSVESLWAELASNENRPSDATIRKICRDLDGTLGDYENGLQGTLDKILPSNNKRQKTADRQ